MRVEVTGNGDTLEALEKARSAKRKELEPAGERYADPVLNEAFDYVAREHQSVVRDIIKGTVEEIKLGVTDARSLVEKVDRLIEHAYVGFNYSMLGKDYLSTEQKLMVESLGVVLANKTLFEILYLVAKQRSSTQYLTDTTFPTLLREFVPYHAMAAGEVPVEPEIKQKYLTRSEESDIKLLADSHGGKMKFATEEFKGKLGAKVISLHKEKSPEKSFPTSVLLGFLPLLGKELHNSFLRSFTTEMTELVNAGVLSSAIEEDAMVYKVVMNDKHTCNYCTKAYVGKVYSYSVLLKNGSNLGKSPSEWKPVVGPHHHRCRCQLLKYEAEKILW